jgi:hypothetical protein
MARGAEAPRPTRSPASRHIGLTARVEVAEGDLAVVAAATQVGIALVDADRLTPRLAAADPQELGRDVWPAEQEADDPSGDMYADHGSDRTS